jgi:hypothetical protein
MLKYLKICPIILLLIGGIGLGQEDTASIYLMEIIPTAKTATTTYEWTLNKTANPTELAFISPFTDEKTVQFAINTEKIEPADIPANYIGSIKFKKTGCYVETLDLAVGWLGYVRAVGETIQLQRVLFLQGPVHFSGGGDYFRFFPIDLSFNIPYEYREYTYCFYRCSTYFYWYDPLGKRLGTHKSDCPIVGWTWTNNYVNNSLMVTDEIDFTEAAGFDWSWDYPDGGWTTTETHTFDIALTISRGTAEYGGHKVTNTAYGTSDLITDLSDYAEVFIDVIAPPGPWEGITYSPGYWKNHQTQTTSLLSNINWFGTTLTWQQAYSILSNPSAKNPWNSFLCHFLATLLNVANDQTLEFAYYNHPDMNGEFMENATVGTIITTANNTSEYYPNAPKATLLQMKDVFDNINNNQTTHVLWTGPQSLSTFSLPTSNSFALYPNPFSDRTAIRLATEMKEPVKVSVYDLTGKKVRDITGAGNSIAWDGNDNNGKKLSHGVYIIRLENSPEHPTVKALICR